MPFMTHFSLLVNTIRLNDVSPSFSQSAESSSTTTRARLSQETAQILPHDIAEKMGLIKVVLSIPALLVFILQVGNPSLLVEGKRAINFLTF